MKGVVLETRGAYAAVLMEDGSVEKIRRTCRVGETIELDDAPKKIVRFPRKATQWVAAAAAALVILSGATYEYNNAYAYSYVTLDANPSIEYVLNRRNQVLSVEALNEDAESIVEALNEAGVRKESLSDAISDTMELLYENEYLGEEKDNCVLINVSSRGSAQQESLTEEANGAIGDEALSVYVTNTTRDEDNRAEELGMSSGRYVLMQDIVDIEGDTSGDMTEENARPFNEAPVKELLERSGRRPSSQEMPENAAQPQEPAGTTAPERTETGAPEGNDQPAQDIQGTAPEQRTGNGEPAQPAQGGETLPSAPAEGNQPAGDMPAENMPAENMPEGGNNVQTGSAPAGENGQALPEGSEPGNRVDGTMGTMSQGGSGASGEITG